MITNFKIFEEYESTLDDFRNIEVGDILISKYDIYIKHFSGSMKWMTPILDTNGDKLFMLMGKRKKISKIDYNGIHLSGFSPGQTIETLHKYFTINDIELKTSMRKYNL